MQPKTSSSLKTELKSKSSSRFQPGFLGVAVCVYICWLIPSLILSTTGFFESEKGAELRSKDYCIRFLIAGWLTFLILKQDFGWKKALYSALLVISGAGMAEILGEILGFPFGRFIYTEKLSWQLFGLLPWVVPIGWFVFVVNAYLLCSNLMMAFKERAPWDAQLLLVLMTAIVVVLIALVFEPVVTNVEQYRYWQERDRPYYGVPLTGFIGWFTVASALAVALSFQLNTGYVRFSTAWISIALLVTIILPLTIRNWQAAQYVPVFIALNLTGCLAIGAAYVSGK